MAGDDEVVDSYLRHGMTMARAGADEAGDAAFDAKVAGARQMPDGPMTSRTAAGLILEVFRSGLSVDELIAIADRHPPDDPRWTGLRAGARAQSLLRASITSGLPDIRAALEELDELAGTTAHDPRAQMLIKSARTAIGYAYARHGGDYSYPVQLLDHMRRLPPLMKDLPQADVMLGIVTGLSALMVRQTRGEDVHRELVSLSETADKLPPDHPMRAWAADMRTAFAPISDPHLFAEEATRPTGEDLAAMVARAERPGLSRVQRAMLCHAASYAALAEGRETREEHVDLGVEFARKAVALCQADDPERVQYLCLLAMALVQRWTTSGASADSVEAERVLAEARDRAGGPHHADWAVVNLMLASVRRQVRGTAHPDTVLDGLRRYTHSVMLQSDPAVARQAAAEAAVNARLAADMPSVRRSAGGDPRARRRPRPDAVRGDATTRPGHPPGRGGPGRPGRAVARDRSGTGAHRSAPGRRAGADRRHHAARPAQLRVERVGRVDR